MTIGETLLAHLERSDIHGECGEEKEFLVRSGRVP
jgi:hypothetical protein